jgi:hypothetical protein
MASTKFSLGVLLFLISILGARLLHGASVTGDQSNIAAAGPSQQAGVQGTWSGTFQSRYPDVVPFTITSVINPDARGRMIGKSRISSDCLKDIDVDLHVTVNGSNVSLAGSDKYGDNVTLQGTIDKTGILNLRYIINGSASGMCELDDGTGTLTKR